MARKKRKRLTPPSGPKETKEVAGSLRLYPSDKKKILKHFKTLQAFNDAAVEKMIRTLPAVLIVVQKPRICEVWEWLEFCVR